jgi:hypothetical protein
MKIHSNYTSPRLQKPSYVGVTTLTEEKAEHLLTKKVVGTTFKVYLHLLKVKHTSARQVYRALGMSSPWLATYHLDKLDDLQLVKKDVNGIYHVKPKRFGMLRFFVITGRWIIPRTFFYTFFFLAAGIYFLFSLPAKWNVVIFALMIIPTLINVIETILFYRALST